MIRVSEGKYRIGDNLTLIFVRVSIQLVNYFRFHLRLSKIQATYTVLNWTRDSISVCKVFFLFLLQLHIIDLKVILLSLMFRFPSHLINIGWIVFRYRKPNIIVLYVVYLLIFLNVKVHLII